MSLDFLTACSWLGVFYCWLDYIASVLCPLYAFTHPSNLVYTLIQQTRGGFPYNQLNQTSHKNVFMGHRFCWLLSRCDEHVSAFRPRLVFCTAERRRREGNRFNNLFGKQTACSGVGPIMLRWSVLPPRTSSLLGQNKSVGLVDNLELAGFTSCLWNYSILKPKSSFG